MGLATHGYINKDHPVQGAVLDILATLGDTNFVDAPTGFDGCGIPVVELVSNRLLWPLPDSPVEPRCPPMSEGGRTYS